MFYVLGDVVEVLLNAWLGVIGCWLELQPGYENFLKQINNIDSAIIYTKEDSWPDGSMTFLDTSIAPQHNGILVTSKYRIPTHMDQYLYWDNQHHIGVKYRVINTLADRVKQFDLHQNFLQLRNNTMAGPSQVQVPSVTLDKMKHRAF